MSVVTPKADMKLPMSAFPRIMSAIGGKADIVKVCVLCLLMTQNGHLSRSRNDDKSAQRDVDAGAAHIIRRETRFGRVLVAD